MGEPCARDPLETECITSGSCNAAKAGCNRGQEYEYDGENRLVRIRRDTNNEDGGTDDGPYPDIPEPILMEFVYDALGRRVETIEYVDAATGEPMTGFNSPRMPRRTRHVYFGLEMIQEYECGGGASGGPSDCCTAHAGPGCDHAGCEQAVCDVQGYDFAAQESGTMPARARRRNCAAAARPATTICSCASSCMATRSGIRKRWRC